MTRRRGRPVRAHGLDAGRRRDRHATCRASRAQAIRTRRQATARRRPRSAGRRLAAQPILDGQASVALRRGVRGLAVGRAGQRRADPPPGPHLRRDRAGDRGPGRLSRGARAVGARQAARAGGAQGRLGRLLAADPGRLRRRAGPAGGGVRRHAGPAGAPGPGAQAVHRLRLARAAHADLLAGRLPRAAGRRGPRRGDPARSSSSRSAARSTGCATWPSSCSISRGWRRARWSCGRSRPMSASSRARSRRSSRRRPSRTSPT